MCLYGTYKSREMKCNDGCGIQLWNGCIDVNSRSLRSFYIRKCLGQRRMGGGRPFRLGLLNMHGEISREVRVPAGGYKSESDDWVSEKNNRSC